MRRGSFREETSAPQGKRSNRYKRVVFMVEENGTRIDLGEDLLEETDKSLVGPPLASLPDEPETVGDRLQSAKILAGEGLVEDAKKILHQILILDSGNAAAKQALTEIHELELKQIFSGTEPRRRSVLSPASDLNKWDAVVDHNKLLKELDHDLGLGILKQDSDQNPKISELSLFQSEELMNDFCRNLENSLGDDSPQVWIDLGIAFLEMELDAVAIRILSTVCRKLELDEVHTGSFASAAVKCLLALALIRVGKANDAIAHIQPLLKELKNKNLSQEVQLEVLYLMGRTYEAGEPSLPKKQRAAYFYQQCKELDPKYRDIEDRLLKL